MLLDEDEHIRATRTTPNTPDGTQNIITHLREKRKIPNLQLEFQLNNT
jgi:hypothetical protein